MDYPIPSHLRDYLVPDEQEENCEFQVTGTIRCTCGCREFSATESNEGMIAHLYCRECGKEIEFTRGIAREDYLSVDKKWGFFSDKDGREDSFDLCEGCYDSFVKTFSVPIGK